MHMCVQYTYIHTEMYMYKYIHTYVCAVKYYSVFKNTQIPV